MQQDCICGQFIHLPKIGAVRIIQHRPLPDGFVIKTATITRKADGWYVTLSLQDSSVPEFAPESATLENTTGIDVGLDSFLVTDAGESVPVPQYYRRAQKRLKRLQRAVSRKKKGSNRLWLVTSG
jgi:putative transposase